MGRGLQYLNCKNPKFFARKSAAFLSQIYLQKNEKTAQKSCAVL